MEITEVNISLKEEEKLKGFANITLDDIFVIRGLKIIQGINRYFIAMPSRRKRDGTYSDVAHPITHSFRKEMEKKVLDKYWETVNQYSSVESLQTEFI
ncbi:septation protein SpoVG family protein [candidate division KSB1 bacterium]|nr:septation protein SpoVG family protein [candidate division KSB1 bacterium]